MRKLTPKATDLIETKYDSDFSELQFGFWDEEAEEFIPLDGSAEMFNIISEKTGLSRTVLDCLQMFAADINDRFNALNNDVAELASKVF